MAMNIVALLVISAFLAGLMVAAVAVYLILKALSSKTEQEKRLERDGLLARLAQAEGEARRVPDLEKQVHEASDEITRRRETTARLESQIVASEKQQQSTQAQLEALNQRHNELAGERAKLAESHARLEQQVESAKQREVETDKLLADAKESMAKEFKLLAGTLLEEKGAKLGEQQRETLASLLTPFGDTLKDFKSKVEQSR